MGSQPERYRPERASLKGVSQTGSYNLAESIMVPSRATMTMTPSSLPPVPPLNTAQFRESTLPVSRLSIMRNKHKESNNQGSEISGEENRMSHRSVTSINRNDPSRGLTGESALHEATDFLTCIQILEKQNYSRKDMINKVDCNV
jgi:hypothetical protein